jgi:hypothetical protein
MTLDMKRFDHLKPDEVQALPRKLRGQVERNRKERMTAWLQRYVERMQKA